MGEEMSPLEIAQQEHREALSTLSVQYSEVARLKVACLEAEETLVVAEDQAIIGGKAEGPNDQTRKAKLHTATANERQALMDAKSALISGEGKLESLKVQARLTEATVAYLTEQPPLFLG